MKSRAAFEFAAALFASLFVTGAGAAESTYPAKSIRLVVGYTPGGGADIAACAIGHQLGEALGQTFVVDNRAGASGLVGTELVAKAPADG